MTRSAVIVIAIIAVQRNVVAQAVELHPRSPILFLEKSYFFPGAPYKRSLLFEGEAAGHYFIMNRLDWTWTQTGGLRHTIPVSMVFSVRMSTDKSEPVRTPSYRIGIKPQLIYAWPEGKEARAFQVLGLSGGFTHYSNGQAGCTYLGFARSEPDQECMVTDPTLASRRVANAIDGDFSTSYLSLAVHGLKGAHYGIRGPVKYQHTASVEFQLHPLGIKPGGMNAQQATEYGQHVLTTSYEFERRIVLGKRARGLLRTALTGGHRFAYRGGRDWTYGTIEASYVFDCLQKFGFVARWHLGSDYYNINFQDTRPLLGLGLIWDPNRIDAFNRIGRGSNPPKSLKVYTCKGN